MIGTHEVASRMAQLISLFCVTMPTGSSNIYYICTMCMYVCSLYTRSRLYYCKNMYYPPVRLFPFEHSLICLSLQDLSMIYHTNTLLGWLGEFL